MDPNRLPRPRDHHHHKPWPLCNFPRAAASGSRRLPPFPRRRRKEPSTTTRHPPPPPIIPDTSSPPPTPTPSPSPPPAARPPTPPPPPPPLLLNSTRDPRPHRSGRLRHVKGMLGLRRMETIDEDDGMLPGLPSGEGDGDGDGEEEEEDVRGRQRTTIHGGEDYAGEIGGGGGSGSGYTSFPPFGSSMSRLRRGMVVQFCREEEGALQGVASSSVAAAAAAWEYPPRKAARLF